ITGTNASMSYVIPPGAPQNHLANFALHLQVDNTGAIIGTGNGTLAVSGDLDDNFVVESNMWSSSALSPGKFGFVTDNVAGNLGMFEFIFTKDAAASVVPGLSTGSPIGVKFIVLGADLTPPSFATSFNTTGKADVF